jgi:cellulose synthase operon protein C
VSISLTARLAHEIPKPRDWQAFQRNCVLLFRGELNDPNAQEYGRGGQDQRGIDILGRRGDNPDHYVGVQCRLIVKPLKEAVILKDCQAALELKAGLKEIIFATTAPDDTRAIDAAIAVERTLRDEGHDLRVIVYGWGALQNLIAVHEVAYAAFCPSIIATSAHQAPAATPSPHTDFATQVAAQVVEQLRQTGVAPPPREAGAAGSKEEDPALHARIDTYRDLFKDHKQPKPAEKGLLALLEKEPLDGKPWARFRIETNLGAIALELGREAEGAARFEAAYAVRPDDPIAIANLALARTIQRRFEEAIALAQQALVSVPRPNHAVAYLLQAAARSAWQGEPESLIPPDLVGSESADFGVAEFLRWRSVPGWAERSLELSRRHPEVDFFKRVRAVAVLALALEKGDFLPGGRAPVSLEDLNRVADDMKTLAVYCLDNEFIHEHDFVANINNAAVLLRLSGRNAECEVLLQRGLLTAPNEPLFRRMLALVQVADGRRPEALLTLAAIGNDPENKLLGVELFAVDDPAAALARALEIDSKTLDPRLGRLRWRLIGDLALRIGDMESLQSAVSGLRSLNAADVTADLLEIRGKQKEGLDNDAVHKRLRAVMAALPVSADMTTRYFVALELCDQDLPEEASLLLEGHVDLARRSPATTLYLQSLAAARRDDAFRKAIETAAPAVRDDPDTHGIAAAHAWNVGDLPGAFRAIEALLAQQPNNPRARLLKIELLARQNRSAELLVELDQPVENLAWTRLQDSFRVAALLGHLGYVERAVSFAYRLFLEHRDNSQAWMTLAILVLEQGSGAVDAPRAWDVPVVAPNVAVDLRYDDGQEVFFVVEPDAALRKLDEESWEPEHPLVQTLLGSPTGARFVGPMGREGTITQLRHKYVARLHYVMQRHQARFPIADGFRSIPVNVEQPGGLDGLIEKIKARHDWIEQEQEQYRNGPWPLAMLAHRVGVDVIDAASGLASQGIRLKVAIGNEFERNAAASAVRKNARRGCVLDLLAFWTAWRLQALDAIVATCGPIHLTQSVLDRLRARRERIDASARDGLRSASYRAGKMVVQEIGPEVFVEWRNDLDRAIAWAEANANICPLVAGDELPTALREHLRAGLSDIFDSVVLAMQSGVLLVTDDLPTREFSRLVGGSVGTWTHQVFAVAGQWRHIDQDTYIRWSAHLVGAGHNYIGMSGLALARALRMDAEAGEVPGYLFKALSEVIGGRIAEPRSHLLACTECLRDLWSDRRTSAYRQPATGLLLRQLIRERTGDYRILIRTLLELVQNLPQLVEYIHAWARGHFIPEALVVDERLADRKRRPKRGSS